MILDTIINMLHKYSQDNYFLKPSIIIIPITYKIMFFEEVYRRNDFSYLNNEIFGIKYQFEDIKELRLI